MRAQYRKAVKKKIAKGVVFESLAPYILKVLLTHTSVDEDPSHVNSSVTVSQIQPWQTCSDISDRARLYFSLCTSSLFQKPSHSVYPKVGYLFAQYKCPRNFLEPWLGMDFTSFDNAMKMTRSPVT